MQAIMTKYLGPTNTKGSRIKAIWQRFDGPVSVTVGYDSAMSQRDNHAYAAMEIVRKYTDNGNNWIVGELPDGNYCFVMRGDEFSRHFGVIK